ncbi:MAG: M23 family metallopeptidase [Desulfobacterales bacterium]
MMMHSKDSFNSDAIKKLYLKKSRFTEMIVKENALDQSGFERWIFCHGMLFNSPDKWWGDHGLRDYPHEGIDLCLYADRLNRIQHINEKTRIPVIQDGVVKAMFKDYLGKAIIVEHEHSGRDIGRFISFYAHTNPRSEIENGVIVKKGDVLATLANTSNSKAKIKPHLHFSIGLPSKLFSYDGFVWNTIRNPEMIILVDPLTVMDLPYQVLEEGNPVCQKL